MKFYRYVEPGEDGVTPVFTTMSVEEIIDTFYPYWCEQMRKVHKENLISPKSCLEDWIVVHWAWEVPARDTPLEFPKDA